MCGEWVGIFALAVETRVIRAGGSENVCLVYIGLHQPEQVRCIAEVVSILVITVGVFW